ncbi:AMP-binding protein [Alloalcanivorax mobilis]|uniref:AMP-binding protein n=1 Tax=Alloalcanivorax mobilis TaxID=2019569 RepID=UPI000B5B2917|nr:AMP-binding protein [Alloalcanivorax mobilis]ASK34416.1 AMP-dependent synthetase [Alcanivorax sp. N3-2A]|tara:strand:- start:5835 stop:7451 length:1617 start_codon:yes stop_codon:yes gene_type:complete
MHKEDLPKLQESHWHPDAPESLMDMTIGDALRQAAMSFGKRPALIEGIAEQRRRAWNFAELMTDAESVARVLGARFAPGERIAVWAANRPEWVLLELGAALAGLTLVTVNPTYTDSELIHVLGHSRVCGVFLQPEYRGRSLLAILETARKQLPDIREIISFDTWESFLQSERTNQALPDVTPDSVAQIQYTSGTTGFPKGAQLTHRGLVNNSRLYARFINAREKDVWINPMPLFHTAGCGLATLGALQTGGTHVLAAGFDVELVSSLIQREKGSIMLCVPTMLIRLLDEMLTHSYDTGSWRLVTLGGAPVPQHLVERAQLERQLKVAIGFGQTEASPYITHTSPDDPHPQWASTIGRPLPGIEVKISDPSTGRTVPLGHSGEIRTRGICVMKGYFDDEAATAKALDEDGWLHTGDLGSMDEYGYCRVLGRLKDMIIRGGENIYPREIEDVLFEHPNVVQAAVVGVPDPEWGESVAAFVQLRNKAPENPESLEKFCRRKLAGFKVPRIWRFVDEFPQTGSGKIQKFRLREALIQEGGSE